MGAAGVVLAGWRLGSRISSKILILEDENTKLLYL